MAQPYLRGLGDTNILIQLERLTAEQLPAELLVSTITLAELSAGVHSRQRCRGTRSPCCPATARRGGVQPAPVRRGGGAALWSDRW